MINQFHLNVAIEKLYICADGRCIINAFYAKKKVAVFVTTAGSTDMKQLNYGVVTVHTLLAIGLARNHLV